MQYVRSSEYPLLPILNAFAGLLHLLKISSMLLLPVLLLPAGNRQADFHQFCRKICLRAISISITKLHASKKSY